MGNTLLPNNPTLDDIKKLIKKINSKIKIINASVDQETLNIDSPIATIIQSESTDPGEYTTTDIDTSNFYTKNEINTALNTKQDTLTFDSMPTIGSMNPVTSEGIKNAIDTKADMAALNNYLPLSGGTMTGTLKTSPSEAMYMVGTFDSTGATPASNTCSPNMRFKDNKENDIGIIQGIYMKDGTTGLNINGRRLMNGSYVNNSLSLGVRSDGTQSVELVQAAWLTALGLTDSGWLSITSSAIGSGQLQYRKYGPYVYVRFNNVKLATELAANSNRQIGTMPIGFRPTMSSIFAMGDRNRWGSCSIETDGKIVFYSDNTKMTTSLGMFGSNLYMCE